MNRKKMGLTLLIAVLFIISISGCTGGKTPSTEAGTTLRVCVGAEPETLDPRKASALTEMQTLKQLFENLTTQSTTGEIIPGVAERWDISQDGLTYKFYLRKDAKWSNGDPVTAHDFEYAWKTALSPELASKEADYIFFVKNGEAYNKKKAHVEEVGIRALDDYTLEVVLERPMPYFLAYATHHFLAPVNKKVVEGNPKWSSDPQTYVCNGPFKLTAWSHNNKIEMVKNENYWRKDVVKLNKVEFVLSDQVLTVLNMYEGNQLDFTVVSPPAAQVPRMIQEGKLKIIPHLANYHYLFNVRKPPFDDVRVRKALTLAIDRQALVATCVRGGEKPAMGWAPYGMVDATPGSDFRKVGGDYYMDNDIETAKRLLAEAGYPDGKGFPEFSLLYNTDENHKMIAEALQGMWKKNLGIDAKLINQEWKVYVQSRNQGNFDMVRRNWIFAYPDPMAPMELLLSDTPNNPSGWKNAEYDRLVNEAKQELDPQKRMRLLHEAEKIAMDELPVLPLYFMTQKISQKPYVKNVWIDGIQSIYLREAYIEK